MHDQVLELLSRHLGGRLKPTGQGNYQTICPFHKGGQERTPSFSVNADNGVWQCFTCHRGGSIKKLLLELGLSRGQVDAETKSIESFLSNNIENWKLQKEHGFQEKDPFRAAYILPEEVLALFDNEPTKLIQDGFDPALLRDMEIGFDPKRKRTTYPLRDLYGNLAGVSGGAIEKNVDPKYRVYEGRRQGEGGRWIPGDFGRMFDQEFRVYHCENHSLLWNYDRVYSRLQAMSDPGATVYVVEGFKACLWMIMAGFQNTVALMGSYISETQQRLLHHLAGEVVLFLDNDPPGRRASLDVGERLWQPMHTKVKVIPYPEEDIDDSIKNGVNTQPDDYELDAVRIMETHKMSYIEYFWYSKRRE